MKLLASTKNFLKKESAGGIIMIFFAFLAVIMANSQFAQQYNMFTDAEIPATGLELKDFVKDVLMIFFFFVVGLELKKEACDGFLKERSQIISPLVAAIFGMVLPALIFFLFNHSDEQALKGWAIPSATDIAFAVCILMIIAKNFPPAAKIFLLTIAIFDDLGAILIIAIFYSSGIKLTYLAISGLITLLLAGLNKYSVKNFTPYLLLGALLAYILHAAGIHTTIAGVITAFTIPFTTKNKNISPVKSLINKFHTPVSFFILPLFAFVSAGVSLNGLDSEKMLSPIVLGIVLGLFIGKQIGIFLPTFIMDKLKLIPKPEGCSWLDVYLVSILAGIGFTMSLFVGMLAYTDPIYHEEVKFAVLTASLIAAIYAYFISLIKKG